MKTRYLLLVLLLIGFCGQSWGQKKASVERLRLFKNGDNVEPTLFWAQYDATRRGSMLFVGKDQRIRVLSENPPDAALETITTITSKIKGLKGASEIEAALSVQKSVADLARRTAAVNMLRDALYRLNELYYATIDEKKDLLDKSEDLMEKYVRVINKVSSADTLLKDQILLDNTSLFQPTLSSNDIKAMFSNVIESAENIAIEEAKVDLEAEKARAEQAKSISKKYETLQSFIEKTKGELTKEEALKFLEELKN